MHTIRNKYAFQIILTAILNCLLLHDLTGQSYIITHYTSKDGLANDNVRDKIADSSGFLWMATWDGLTRYDGTEFHNYYHNPGDSSTIPYFSVNRVVIDAKDNLWVAADNGQVSMLNRATDKFTTIGSLDSHSLQGLVNFESGPDGCLYFVLASEVLIYDPATGKSSSFGWSGENADSLDLLFARYLIIFDREKHIWLAGDKILEIELLADKDGRTGKAMISSINRVERKAGRVGTFFDQTGYSRMTYDRSGRMLLASRTGLFLYEKDSKLFREYSDSVEKISFADTLPVIYFDRGKGLNIWLPESDSVMTIPSDECGLPMVMYTHDPSLIWISYLTVGGTPAGICKIIITPYSFTIIDPFPEKNNPLNVFGIIEDSHKGLWIAARDRNYLIRIDSDGSASRINTLTDSDINRLWHPRSFLSDTNGLWIGYYLRDLLYYDLRTGQLRKYYSGREVHTTCFNGNGKILIGDRGIIRFDPVSGNSERLLSLSDSMGIYTFYLDGNILWGGCNYSLLLKYDVSTGCHEFIRLTEGITNIENICPGTDGELWLALLGSGVCRYNPATGSKTFYTTATGLSNNTTYSILRDRPGNFWVSTNDGISVINQLNGQIRSYGSNDGLMIHEFNSDAAFASDDGMFYFGGVGGVVRFSPEQVLRSQTSNTQNNILITSLDVSGTRRILTEPVYKADTILFGKGEDDFHISFIVPEYRYPEKIKYRYRLGDESESWNLTDYTNRNIAFSNLEPGWHKLEIQATGADGSWTRSRKVAIYVRPFFYQTIFFRIAAPMTVTLLLSLLAYFLFAQFRQKEKQKREALRHQALRGQMNPHFIFNALNSINYFISRNDRLSANRYIADFSKLIRTALTNLNEEFVRLSTELESIEDYLKIEHLRFGDRFDYSITVGREIVPGSITVSPGLIQPFIENAIWHGIMGLEGRKGLISLTFSMRNKTLVCTIDDDGIGRTRSEAMKDGNSGKKSRGIELARERLGIINNLQSASCQIRISDLYPDRKDTGTHVEIEMPVQQL